MIQLRDHSRVTERLAMTCVPAVRGVIPQSRD